MENINELLKEKISAKGINNFTFEIIFILVELLEEQGVIPKGEFVKRIAGGLLGEEKLKQLAESFLEDVSKEI